MGDHRSLAVTHGYVSRYPTKAIWERMIREFQVLFQAVAVRSIKGAARKLGLSIRRAKRLFSKACRTGLGVACLDPTSGIQPGSTRGETCTQLQNCLGCPNSIVIATIENLRDLIIWNHHVATKRQEWEATRPEKWQRDWLPWLVFTEVAMQKAKRGRTAPIFQQAAAKARVLIDSGGVNLPELW